MKYMGLHIVINRACQRPPSPAQTGVRIVRHGLGDVLEWLGEEVGPRPDEPIETVYRFLDKVMMSPAMRAALMAKVVTG